MTTTPPPAEGADAAALDLDELRRRWTPVAPPPCRVCGGPLTISISGGGERTVWGCSGWEDDPEHPGAIRRQEGRRIADDHYAQSRWTEPNIPNYAGLLLLDRLAAAEQALAEERALREQAEEGLRYFVRYWWDQHKPDERDIEMARLRVSQPDVQAVLADLAAHQQPAAGGEEQADA